MIRTVTLPNCPAAHLSDIKRIADTRTQFCYRSLLTLFCLNWAFKTSPVSNPCPISMSRYFDHIMTGQNCFTLWATCPIRYEWKTYDLSMLSATFPDLPYISKKAVPTGETTSSVFATLECITSTVCNLKFGFPISQPFNNSEVRRYFTSPPRCRQAYIMLGPMVSIRVTVATMLSSLSRNLTGQTGSWHVIFKMLRETERDGRLRYIFTDLCWHRVGPWVESSPAPDWCQGYQPGSYDDRHLLVENVIKAMLAWLLGRVLDPHKSHSDCTCKTCYWQ